MRRRALILVACGLLLAGCGGKTVSPSPQTVEGTLPTTAEVKGDPAAGKTVFTAQGCNSCHTYKPAGSNGTVGPDLDNLATDAEKAGQPLAEYVHTSIVDPNSYVVPGFAQGIMPSTYTSLSEQQLADLVAFLTQKS